MFWRICRMNNVLSEAICIIENVLVYQLQLLFSSFLFPQNKLLFESYSFLFVCFIPSRCIQEEWCWHWFLFAISFHCLLLSVLHQILLIVCFLCSHVSHLRKYFCHPLFLSWQFLAKLPKASRFLFITTPVT